MVWWVLHSCVPSQAHKTSSKGRSRVRTVRIVFFQKGGKESWRLRSFLEERLWREKLTNSRWAWVSEFIDWDEVVKSNVKTNKSQLGRLELSSSRKLKLKWTIPLIQLLTFIFSLSRTILRVEYKTIHGFSNLYHSSTTHNINVHHPLLDTICWQHLNC